MNTTDLKGRTAVITGAARGIGLAIAERFLKSGANCAIWDRDQAALAAAKTSLSKLGNCATVEVDVTSPESIKAATDNTLEQFSSVEILVNNAGVAGVSKKLWECTPQEWFDVMNIDLYGVFLCCHALVPQMITKKYGRIVNIASIAGKEGNPNASHYSAAKAGVIGLTKSLGKELAQTGILVNCIAPAVIETDILKQVSQEHINYMVSRIPMGRVGQTQEVAALVAWLCSEECSFSTGAVFDISGGRATY
jgi:NAD(P)-dependent dehydrogenase (short-subunit alcohol dehydrogenase family)